MTNNWSNSGMLKPCKEGKINFRLFIKVIILIENSKFQSATISPGLGKRKILLIKTI